MSTTKHYRLSDSMYFALKFCTELGYLNRSYRDTTMTALERRGLVRWFPYSTKGLPMQEGIWKPTREGKRAMEVIKAEKS